MGAGRGTDTSAEGAVISLPKGGGAVGGVGDKFAADPQTGSGSFSVPIAVPPGRNGLQPKLSLAYSTGGGNGAFGLGWTLSLPVVARKTSRGVPRYGAGGTQDTFVLSGAEDLVPVPGGGAGRQRYRPRTEGMFARTEHVRDEAGDRWEIRDRDGLLSRYGTPRPPGGEGDWRDPAAVQRASDGAVFAWRITETVDPVGNRIRYTYRRDGVQALVSRIEYADYGDRRAPSFLSRIELEYEERPDPFSDRTAGFEIRTTLRCHQIRVLTLAADGVSRTVREYRLRYEQAPFSGVSLLTRVEVVGVDEQEGVRREEPLAPLTFGYTAFEPAGRRFATVTGAGLPPVAWSDPTLALVDLRGSGLPDLVELGSTQRYWSNRGNGRFDLARQLAQAPPYSLDLESVRLLDADGDGRADLFVSAESAGYFPLTFAGGWSKRSFQPYAHAPAVALSDPAVKLIDLDGDGLTDVLRSGSRLECWFNDPDPRRAWRRTASSPSLGVDLADPRVRLADMTGDGLQDIVLLRDGNVTYWPSLGHGRWGTPVVMTDAPRLPPHYDPRRILLGDIDGDGVADLVYVDRGRVLLWGNRGGNGWTATPVAICGTPDIVDEDDVRLADLYGTGMSGVLWSSRSGPPRFLDLCGGLKPHLMSLVNNHMGARTTVGYRTSTSYFVADHTDPGTRWRTTLPFPVQVVATIRVEDLVSGGRLTTRYRYRHGYWDGVEREFRGFAMVEQLDTESFAGGAHDSPPTLTKSWFHVGPVAAAQAGEWAELDLSDEYWPGDTAMLERPAAVRQFLEALPRTARRDALRALRGQLVRSELYALDGTEREDRPYTVTESLSGVREESPPTAQEPGRGRVFFAFPIGQRTTQYERGDDSMTSFGFSAGYDEYGFAAQNIAIAVPRGRDPRWADPQAGEPYLATYAVLNYARRDDAERYLVDRVCQTTTYEVGNTGRTSVKALRDMVLHGIDGVQLSLIGRTRMYFDGEPFQGHPLGVLGSYGLPVRTETLAFTDGFLDALGSRPAYLVAEGSQSWPSEYPQEFRDLMPPLAGYSYDDGGYYIVSDRRRYDIHEPTAVPRGLLLSTLDAHGAAQRVEYDEHDLLPLRTVDAAGLVVTAWHDLRLLQPHTVSDVNGNTSTVTFSPAGLVTSRFVRGDDGRGDAVAPSERYEHDLLAFEQRRQPVSVRSIRRIHHDTETGVPSPERDEVLVSVQYSDGFGRPLQTRAQAEETPNVVVSGWLVYDNKGRPVEEYEPFFATGWDYAPPGEAQLGQKLVVRYDPRGNRVATIHPDGSEQLVVMGVPRDLADPEVFTPTPWERFTYDANDNAGRTHGEAAMAYRSHWNTPSSVEFDALGRAVKAVARNGSEPADWHVTRSTFDIRDNLVAVQDAAGREAFRYRVDLAGRRWRVDSIDAGRRDTVPDALGSMVECRDGRGALTLASFDVLHRQIRLWARDYAGATVGLRQRLEYGDGGNPGQPSAEREAARRSNLLGRVTRHFDEAGLVTIIEADFKGNVVDSSRQVIADDAVTAVYQAGPGNGWTINPFRVDWAAASPDLLETTVYQSGARFDALNRVVRQVLPRDVEGRRRELVARYSRAGGLQQVLLDGTVYIGQIGYDAKGNRVLVSYGNSVTTRYSYHPTTFRLIRILSERGGEVLQDYGYDHDLAGNPVRIRDRSPGCGLPVTPDALDRLFTYDPIYQLCTATGRESDTMVPGPPWTDLPRGGDVTRTRAYTETYTYDNLGNLRRLEHTSVSGFTRDFEIGMQHNRLNRLVDGATPYDYAFDANGNLRSEGLARAFDWGHTGQLLAFSTQTPSAEPSVHAQYLCDSTGQRVKKLVRRQGGAVEVTHYLGAIFEHHRWSGGQNNYVHVMDDTERVALVRFGQAHPGDRGPATVFHLADHLGSSTVVMDAAGAPVSREEYTPYGETSFGSFSRKRYRYTGKERDEESGLAYHGSRYLHPALGRWLSCDPIGVKAQVNLYRFAANSPLRFVDPGGTSDKDKIELIAWFLQEMGDEFLESAHKRANNETPQKFGQRMHDALQRYAESGEFNSTATVKLGRKEVKLELLPGRQARRIVPEVIIDKNGIIIDAYKKPTGPRGAVTVDIVILKAGVSNAPADLIGRKAADVIDAGIDYKTGGARLAKHQKEFFEKINKPLYKLTKNGDLPGDVVGRCRTRARGAAGFLLDLAIERFLSGETPGAADVATMAVMNRFPSVGIATASKHGDEALPIMCYFAPKACLVAGVGALAFYGGYKAAEYVDEKVTETLEAAGQALQDLDIPGRSMDAITGASPARK